MVNRKRVCSLISILCLIITQSWAIEFQPWIDDYLEFKCCSSWLYQGYSALAIDSRYKKYSSDDFFLTTSLSNALKSNFSLEAEITAARTRKQSGGIDHVSLAGRYVWLDDVAGDPLTITTGLIFSQSFVNSVHDISSFHHGREEAELFVSLGKELTIEGEQWTSRCWTVVGMGRAVRSETPWIRAALAYDRRIKRIHEVGVFANTLWGLGHKKLNPDHFHGYGPVQHQSIDLGLHYTHILEYFGHFSIEYSYRAYARNFPAHTSRVLFTLFYTFGL